jgi:hypothetical protein
VTNEGEKTSENAFDVSFYMGDPDEDGDGVVDDDAKLIGTDPINEEIGIGEVTYASIQWVPENTLEVESYEIYVVIDPDDMVDESIENNNEVFTAKNIVVKLRVPYLHQGNTEWCTPTSLAMMLKYYGKYLNAYDLAEVADLGHGEGCDIPEHLTLDLFISNLDGLNCDYVLQIIEFYDRDAWFNEYIKDYLESGRPVYLCYAIHGADVKHAIVIVGYSIENGDKYVYFHDPSVTYSGLYDNKNMFAKARYNELWSDLPKWEVIDTIVITGDPNPHPAIYLKGGRSAGSPSGPDIRHIEDGNVESFLYFDKGIKWLNTDGGNYLLWRNNNKIKVKFRASNPGPEGTELDVTAQLWRVTEEGKNVFADAATKTIPIEPEDKLIMGDEQAIVLEFDEAGKYWLRLSAPGNRIGPLDFEVKRQSMSLPVPYFYQDGTKWCVMNSVAMVMQYWGERVHSWDLARILQKPHDDGIDYVFSDFCGSVETCVNTLSEGRLEIEECCWETIQFSSFEDSIVSFIDDGKPIIFGFPVPDNHAVVVCGYSREEDGDYVFVHDPGPKMWSDTDNIFIKVSWDEFKGGYWEVLRCVISPASDANPNPPAVALNLVRESFLHVLQSPTESVTESYLDLDKGIPYKTNEDLDLPGFDCSSSNCLRYLGDITINGYQETDNIIVHFRYSAAERPQGDYQIVIKNGDEEIYRENLEFDPQWTEDDRTFLDTFSIPLERFEIGDVHLFMEAGGDIIGPIDFEIVSPAAPVADSNGPYAGNEGSPITFDASGSYDLDGSIDLYEWDFGGDGVYDVSSAISTAIFTWGDDYTGTVELRVTDNNGLSGTGTASITVNNVAPTASIVSVEQPEDFILPYHSLTFNGASTDAGWLDTHVATWDFGDGTVVSGTLTEENDQPDATGTTPAEHAYSEPGEYTVRLTVTDDDGGVGDYEEEVIVISAEEATGIIIDQLGSPIVPDEAPKGVSQKIESAIDNLEQVIDFLDQGKYCDAIGKLDGVITQIEGAIDQVNEQRCSIKECSKGKECICIADEAANELIECLEQAKEGAIAIGDLISAEHPECAYMV